MGLNVLTQPHKFTDNVDLNTVSVSSLTSPTLDSVYTTVKSLSDSWEESAFITPLQTASANWDSAYSTINSLSAFRINNTITSDYTFSDLDNTKTYHVDTTSGILSGIFPNSISNNFSVNLILVSTNAFVVSSSQTPILSSNGNKVNLPFSSVLIYKYNDILYGLGNFY